MILKSFEFQCDFDFQITTSKLIWILILNHLYLGDLILILKSSTYDDFAHLWPWLNNTLRDSIKEKQRLHNLCQEQPDFFGLYKQQRNLVSNKMKQAKMQYYNDKFNSNLHDAESTWKIINKILKPNSKKQNDF